MRTENKHFFPADLLLLSSRYNYIVILLTLFDWCLLAQLILRFVAHRVTAILNFVCVCVR